MPFCHPSVNKQKSFASPVFFLDRNAPTVLPANKPNLPFPHFFSTSQSFSNLNASCSLKKSFSKWPILSRIKLKIQLQFAWCIQSILVKWSYIRHRPRYKLTKFQTLERAFHNSNSFLKFLSSSANPRHLVRKKLFSFAYLYPCLHTCYLATTRHTACILVPCPTQSIFPPLSATRYASAGKSSCSFHDWEASAANKSCHTLRIWFALKGKKGLFFLSSSVSIFVSFCFAAFILVSCLAGIILILPFGPRNMLPKLYCADGNKKTNTMHITAPY